MKNFNIILPAAIILTFSFLEINCKSDTTGPVSPVSLAPATNIRIIVAATGVGGGSFSSVTWDNSTDVGLSDFTGYAVVTDSVDVNGNSLGRFDSGFVSKTAIQVYNVLSLIRGKLFKSLVYSTTDTQVSQSAASVIYSGVYLGDGQIDEYSTSSSTKSAFGWDPQTGVGTQYDYVSLYSGSIDLEMRSEGGQLTFYSPGAVPNNPITYPRETKFSIVGTGENFFDKWLGSYSDLTEPSSLTIGVTKDNVYLIKTQDSTYIKLWVKDITGTAYKSVNFSYKLQPVQNLKVLKR